MEEAVAEFEAGLELELMLVGVLVLFLIPVLLIEENV